VNDGGSAFPRVSRQNVKGMDHNGYAIERQAEVYFPGMTLRDYFAAAALQSVSCGIIAEANHGTTELSLAATAFNIADAMLAVRVESPIPQK
jgi:hypothetical protein